MKTEERFYGEHNVNKCKCKLSIPDANVKEGRLAPTPAPLWQIGNCDNSEKVSWKVEGERQENDADWLCSQP
jgi:hypothetical protein